jgi:hypothetical protein
MKRGTVLFLLMLASNLAYGLAIIQPTSVPALDEGGLVALIALIGVVGGIVARRRKT